jgi:hypothetical protein
VTYNWAIIPKLTKRRDDGFLLTPGHFSVLFNGQLVGKCAVASIYLFRMYGQIQMNEIPRKPKVSSREELQSAGHDGTRPQHAQGAEAEKEAQEQGRRTSPRED